jgi:hypothetical protein
MILNRAALLALIGIGLLTILLAEHFILDILNAARGLAPAMRVLTSLIWLRRRPCEEHCEEHNSKTLLLLCAFGG